MESTPQARRFADIAITSEHYLDKKRLTVGLGQLLQLADKAHLPKTELSKVRKGGPEKADLNLTSTRVNTFSAEIGPDPSTDSPSTVFALPVERMTWEQNMSQN